MDSENRQLEFRFSFYTQKYKESIVFYKDIIQLPVVYNWNRGFNDSGYLFKAASGHIVVLQSATKQVEPLIDAVLLIEVDDIDAQYEFCKKQGVDIVQAIQKREWGDRDFKVADPNRLILGFYSGK
ncbi:MAG: VOC family protein [Spirochaetales bacterium]|nr:VOC family protein [Spirochaetales bacterium]